MMWNAALDPMKVLFVVHCTMLPPPPCAVAQPCGRLPETTPLKFSAKIWLAIGVPVARPMIGGLQGCEALARRILTAG